MEILVGLILSIAAAVVPIATYSLLIWWADRYEREPFWLLAVAFLWGAIPAILLVIITHVSLGGSLEEGPLTFIYAWLEAPVTEELVKGLAVLGLFVFHRKQFDGVLDGLVYGALVGFGFSMTEDFLYYLSALSEGGLAGLLPVMVLRGIFFALNHSVYTGLLGISFGLASVSRSRFKRVMWPVLGFVAAVICHSLHNFGAFLLADYGEGENAALGVLGLLLSLAFAALGLVLIVSVVIGAWFFQRRIIKEELTGLVGKLLTEQELKELSTKWTQPVACGKPATLRKRKLVQLALRQRRLKSAGSGNEQDLVTETGRLHHELQESFADSGNLA
jgi:RsiW-degrading membrane proteinase PrsW (M82 family)